MKMSKTILPALAMLLVSAVMLSTASFAWFAIGSSVEANGMAVDIKSDSAALVIAKTSGEITAQYTGAVISFGNQATAIAPAAVDEAFFAGYTGDFRTKAAAEGTWYKKVADDRGSSTSSSTAIPITNDQLAGYVVKYTMWIAVSAQTNYSMSDVTAKVTLSGDPSVGVLIVGPNGFANLKNDGTDSSLTLPVAGTSATIVDQITSTPVEIHVYVYYNGNHNNIYTNNLLVDGINAATVSVTFTAEPATATPTN